MKYELIQRLMEVRGGGLSAVMHGAEQYDSLNDAEHTSPILSRGNVEVWYMNKNSFRDFNMGLEFMREKMPEKLPKNPRDLKKTHELLGKIKGPANSERDVEKIFIAMQGENWSPEGEAWNLIKKSNTSHTSMSIGDIVSSGNKMWFISNSTIEKL